MQLKKFLAVGVLLGLAIGVFVSFMFPNLLMFGVEFNSTSNEQLGLPNYTPKFGSILNSLMVIPLLVGIMGGVLGFIIFKLLRLK